MVAFWKLLAVVAFFGVGLCYHFAQFGMMTAMGIAMVAALSGMMYCKLKSPLPQEES